MKKPKVEKSTTPFQSINNYNYLNEGFGGAVANKIGKDLNVKSSLGEMKPLYNQANTGLQNNLGAINAPLEQQYAGMMAGNNPFYNYQKEILNREYDNNVGSATARYAQSGLENSTSRGAYEAALATNRGLQDLAVQDQSIRLVNDANRANAATNAGVLDQLYTYQNNPSQLASNSILTGLQSVGQNNQFNAQAQNQANIQAAQQQNALVGNLIQSGLAIGATALTGGLAAPAAASSLGGLAGARAAGAAAGALGGLSRGF